MKALEINVKNINKLSFIYNLNSYCFIHATPVINGAMQDNMIAFYNDNYLHNPIVSDPIIEEITKSQYWEYSYVGFRINSMDILRATLIQSIDYSSVFFHNNLDNISFWKSKLIEITSDTSFECSPIRILFDWNRDLVNDSNPFQVWWKNDIVDFDDGLSDFKMIVTGTLSILENIYSQFTTSTPSHIGNYLLFSFEDNSIQWIDI